ncbi:iron ABC transporter permease [Candidatus Bathyarchaeota archaeon]|nr:iron ABC transporter permease [Candidatus Bathyarchaeota archaeon]
MKRRHAGERPAPQQLSQNARTGFLVAILVLTVIVSLSMGSVDISVQRILSVLVEKMKAITSGTLHRSRTVEDIIILQIRLPRVLVGVAVGASLAVSGVVFQAIFKNPMASPFVTGVSSGAALGASVGIILGASRSIFGLGFISISALLGALVAVLLVSIVSRAGSDNQVLRLLLSGLAVSYLFSAATSLIMILSGEEVHAVLSWLMGGLTNSTWAQVEVGMPIALLGVLGAYIFSRELNIMLLSDEEAQHLGVEVGKVRRSLVILASATTAVAVSLTGTIGFVGLMTPHLARTIFGADHRILVPTSAILGSMTLVISDAIARTILIPSEIPVGIITSLLGGPFFIYLLVSRRRTKLL